MNDLQSVDVTANAEATNAAVAAVLSDTEPAPAIAPQPSGFIRLAGGLVRGLDPNEVEYDAEVRELDGSDEEYIDRIKEGRPENFFRAVIERGVVAIGDKPFDAATRQSLLLGDAEVLFMEIARATYGGEIEYPYWNCPSCDELLSVTVEFDEIPIERLKATGDRYFDVPLRKGGTAHCRLPFLNDLEVINSFTTEAEKKTALIAQCVLALTDAKGNKGPVSGSLDAARAIGSADRNKITIEIANRRVGPLYNEVKVTHEACGKESPFPISMGDLFPLN